MKAGPHPAQTAINSFLIPAANWQKYASVNTETVTFIKTTSKSVATETAAITQSLYPPAMTRLPVGKAKGVQERGITEMRDTWQIHF